MVWVICLWLFLDLILITFFSLHVPHVWWPTSPRLVHLIFIVLVIFTFFIVSPTIVSFFITSNLITGLTFVTLHLSSLLCAYWFILWHLTFFCIRTWFTISFRHHRVFILTVRTVAWCCIIIVLTFSLVFFNLRSWNFDSVFVQLLTLCVVIVFFWCITFLKCWTFLSVILFSAFLTWTRWPIFIIRLFGCWCFSLVSFLSFLVFTFILQEGRSDGWT